MLGLKISDQLTIHVFSPNTNHISLNKRKHYCIKRAHLSSLLPPAQVRLDVFVLVKPMIGEIQYS